MKLPKLKRGDLVEVEWKDHWAQSSGWYAEAEIVKELRNVKNCRSVARYWGKNRHVIVLYGSDDGEGTPNFGNLQYIYRNHIVKLRKR